MSEPFYLMQENAGAATSAFLILPHPFHVTEIAHGRFSERDAL